jgi:hypothetical protein
VKKVKKEDVMPFLGKYVKLEFCSGFVINGEIVKISEDAVFFKTPDTISAVSLGNINTVVLKGKGERR